MKNFDKDLMICVFLFLILLGLWVWLRNEYLQHLIDGLFGALVMGLRTGMGLADNISNSGNTTVNSSIATTQEKEIGKE